MEEWGGTSDVWSVPSFTELARDGREVERWNLLHPTQTAKRSYVEECLGGMTGPVIASSDWVRAFPEQIRPYVTGRYPRPEARRDGKGRARTCRCGWSQGNKKKKK